MGHTAVIHLFRYFRHVQFAIGDQFFYAFNFMGNDEPLNAHSLYGRKLVGQVGVIMV